MLPAHVIDLYASCPTLYIKEDKSNESEYTYAWALLKSQFFAFFNRVFHSKEYRHIKIRHEAVFLYIGTEKRYLAFDLAIKRFEYVHKFKCIKGGFDPEKNDAGKIYEFSASYHFSPNDDVVSQRDFEIQNKEVTLFWKKT